jgi:hypothetical protein
VRHFRDVHVVNAAANDPVVNGGFQQNDRRAEDRER